MREFAKNFLKNRARMLEENLQRGIIDGLREEIPISAQIVSLADVYDALVNERVYKSAFSKGKAFQMITTGECGVFSPKLLDCLWNVRKEFEQIADQHRTE